MHRVFAILVIGLFFCAFVQTADASATYYFNPQRKSLRVGEAIRVELRLNTDNEAVNAHSALISYPSDMLNVSAVSTGNTFSIEAQRSFSDGFIEISEGNIDPVSGDVLIATLLVTGEKEGTVTMSFAGGSAVARYSDSSDALSLSRSISGFYTIVDPAAAFAPTQPKILNQIKKINPFATKSEQSVKKETLKPTTQPITTSPLPTVKPTAVPTAKPTLTLVATPAKETYWFDFLFFWQK